MPCICKIILPKKYQIKARMSTHNSINKCIYMKQNIETRNSSNSSLMSNMQTNKETNKEQIVKQTKIFAYCPTSVQWEKFGEVIHSS